MELDRALIKNQAKDLIKNCVFPLFLLIFVVILLSGGLFAFFDKIDSVPFSSEDISLGDNYLGTVGGLLYRVSGVAAVIFAPLAVTLAGILISFVNGKHYTLEEEFTYVFKNTFDGKYAQKFLLRLLVTLFTVLWSLLFIIPGIVYHYKTYFVDYIMAEYPNLSWSETIEASKKLTNNRKGEIFMFDLSFILWFIALAVSAGFAGIYVLPYYYTAQTLFYENFKHRALMTGEISEYDFKSNAEKMAEAMKQQKENPQQYAQPAYPQYQRPVQPQYAPPVNPQQYVPPVVTPYQYPVQPQYAPPVISQQYVPPVVTPYQYPVQPQYVPPAIPQQPVQPQYEEQTVIGAASAEDGIVPEPVPENYTPPAEIKDYYDSFNDTFSGE